MKSEKELQSIKEVHEKIIDQLKKENDSVMFLAKDKDGMAFRSYGERTELSFLITMALSQIKKKDPMTFAMVLIGLKATMEGELDL